MTGLSSAERRSLSDKEIVGWPASGKELALWFIVGLLVAVALQWLTAAKYGGDWTALINVGVDAEVRPFIERDLGPVADYTLEGHDGRSSYVVARDPWGTRGYLEYLDSPAYRTRRWLYSALASGFGLLGPWATLMGLLAWSAVGMGLATSAATDIGRQLGARWWAPLAVLTNIGILLSVTLSTSDTLALGFSLLGIATYLRARRGLAITAFVAAALTKETFVIAALGLAIYAIWRGDRRTGLVLASVPTLAALILTAAVMQILPGAPLDNGSLGVVPFAGYSQAIREWSHFRVGWAVGVPASAVLMTSIVVAFTLRHRLLLCVGMPWVAMAAFSSVQVWRVDALRIFAVSYAVLLLGLAVLIARQDRIHSTQKWNGASLPGSALSTVAGGFDGGPAK